MNDGDRFGLRAYARGAARVLGWRFVDPVSHVPAEHARKIAEILADAVRQRNDRDEDHDG